MPPWARGEILRVVEVRSGGAVTLEGKCGRRITNNVSNLAPCHLPVDPTIDPTLAHPSAGQPCEVCRFPDDAARMLLCDACGGGWHLGCLEPALEEVPEGRSCDDAHVHRYCNCFGDTQHAFDQHEASRR